MVLKIPNKKKLDWLLSCNKASNVKDVIINKVNNGSEHRMVTYRVKYDFKTDRKM